MSDEKLLENIKKDSTRAIIDNYESDGIQIRYVDVGVDTNRMVIFIHGAPGSLDAFNNFLRDSLLRQNVRMIAMDRPGYGHSNFGISETSISKQAEQIAPLLDKNRHDKKPILVGHSYGATIAAQLAMDYPDKLEAIILVGAAVDPEHEKFFLIARLIEFPLIDTFVPASLKVANDEKVSHIDELKLLLTGWEKITNKVIILHGEKDGLVPVENAYFAKKVLINAETKLVIYKDTGHLIPWTNPALIKNEILSLIN